MPTLRDILRQGAMLPASVEQALPPGAPPLSQALDFAAQTVPANFQLPQFGQVAGSPTPAAPAPPTPEAVTKAFEAILPPIFPRLSTGFGGTNARGTTTTTDTPLARRRVTRGSL